MYMNIYNFEHGFKNPKEIRVGSYIFKIDQSHCNATTKLAIPPRTEFAVGWGKIKSRSIKKIRPSWQITAHLHYFEPSKPPLFYKNTNSFNELDDLCLLASFLTGRRVCTRRSIHRVHPGKFGKPLVRPIQLFSALEKSIEYKEGIKNSNSITALHNLISAQGANEVTEAGVYVFSAINSLYEEC
ncbi:hypothetical protein [Leptospira kmetyi]|uniref:hypothetical protein n=1 Tax=Leptospira kmetyi TaxID=408139 RepID=UPI000289215A|nr:hypothetical protein [Leptospira kmetyi]